ncbi:docking protein 1b isoform X2 [Denticeps clupeoides]|uniref:docking protein 1b isoform X2 n=1 Tax=Denticeps clupeoides TaxID=299321 RepID=UPI0010A4921B|nr:docking protein 1 isoform X2 [Denticeps clupeoides]XP_028855175.1 docking protein 1 isoform X2 [Denticeps clupeoides]XP_028855183.1 docking protein 1 isoform X2 [Denticeps clupeoides]
MDSHVKEGQLYVQHQKFGKKWKKNWFVLYPASQNGIARLEFYDCSGNSTEKPSTKKLDKKIIRLSECISILPAVTETCPKDNMSAFCVETNDKTHVFAAEKHVSNEWVDKMCEIAFQGGSACLSSSESNVLQELQMAENLIYYSRDEVNEFWVTVQRTEASERCGLLGSYCLKADRDSLIIKEAKSKKDVLVWPYKLLRRYGRDRVMFSFEAGRRCDSGPGNFTFETKQGNEIFMIVENAIREQKAQAEERHQSCPSLDSDCPALQQIRSAIVEGNSRDPDGDSGGSKPGSADGVFNWREGTDAKNLKGRSLPEPPAPVGGTPPRSPMHRGTKGSPILDDQSNLYSEPADSVRLPPSLSDSLYSDPVDSIKPGSTPIPNLRLRPLGDEGGSRQTCNKPEPFYSDIYDRVNVDLAQRTAGLVVERRPAEGGHAEHIYDEPEGHGGAPSSLPSITTVYDETRLESQTWRARGTDDAQLYKPDDYSASSFVKPAQQQPPPTTARPKGPKPLTAPKPTRAPRKEPPPFPPGKVASNLNNNNSSSRSSPTSYSGGGGSGGPVVTLDSRCERSPPLELASPRGFRGGGV